MDSSPPKHTMPTAGHAYCRHTDPGKNLLAAVTLSVLDGVLFPRCCRLYSTRSSTGKVAAAASVGWTAVGVLLGSRGAQGRIQSPSQIYRQHSRPGGLSRVCFQEALRQHPPRCSQTVKRGDERERSLKQVDQVCHHREKDRPFLHGGTLHPPRWTGLSKAVSLTSPLDRRPAAGGVLPEAFLAVDPAEPWRACCLCWLVGSV